MITLKQLFHPHQVPSDGLTQAQRETIVDLLNFCSYVDHDIADSEEVLIDSLEHQLHWDANIDFDYYVNKSVGAVRKALEGDDAQSTFLRGIGAKLDSKQSRTLALSLADKLFKADGRMTPQESDALQAIRKVLG